MCVLLALVGPQEVKEPMLRDAIVAFQQFITIYVNEYRCIDDHVASGAQFTCFTSTNVQIRTHTDT